MEFYSGEPENLPASVTDYCTGGLSFRDVEDLLAERGIDVSYATVRRWALKFGQAYAGSLMRTSPRSDGRLHLDEMFAPSMAGNCIFGGS